MVVAVARARGDMDRAIADLGSRWAATRTTQQLLAEVGALPGHHRNVFGTTVINHLIDAIVHHRDIALALGRGLNADPTASAMAADSTWSLPKRFTIPVTRRLVGFRWSAIDTDWIRGDGPPIEGPMVAILCALVGRAAAYEFLDGPGVSAALAATNADA